MKQRVPHPSSPLTVSRPSGLDTKTWAYIEPIIRTLQQSYQKIGRFRFSLYLAAIYRTYREWKDLGISKRMASHLAEHLDIPRRRDTSPVRILIDATFPALDPKQKSRWSRALEFAALTETTPDELPRLFKNHSGISGCARFAAKRKPKKDRYRDDWA